MAIQTVTMKNTVATAYGSAAAFGALATTAPGSTAGTEVTGGSPVYARKALTWGASSGGVILATAVFNIPSGTTVIGTMVYSALTGGTYLDGDTITSQVFSSQGTLTVNFTFTES